MVLSSALPATETSPLPHALEIWDNAARLGLPAPLKVWLGLLVLSFLASLFFVRRHRAARWVAGGFMFSHLLVVLIEVADLVTLRTGLVSVTHVLGWTPALVAVVRDLPRAPVRSRYGAWCRVIVFFIGASLIFDVRDAVMYFYYQLAGHPGLLL